jgi:hypothetical protein
LLIFIFPQNDKNQEENNGLFRDAESVGKIKNFPERQNFCEKLPPL